MPPRIRFSSNPSAERGVFAAGCASFWTLVLACIGWSLAHTVLSANLDSYHDMLETYAWGQTWPLGTYKHPPFFAWVAQLWFSVMPQTVWGFFLLSFTNVLVGLLGVMALARRLGLAHHGASAALLLMLALPYTTLASKFNANSQLLSLWPWTAWALLASWQSAGWRGMAASLALGALSAAAMLTKYFSGVLLLSLLLVSVGSASGRRWLKSPKPYVALAVFFLLLWPHFAWLQQHAFATLRYAQEQGTGSIAWRHWFKFALTPVLLWLPAWLCLVLVARRQMPAARLLDLARRIWQPTQDARAGGIDVLFWLALLPWMITLAFGLSGKVDLSLPWAIPLGFGFTLLWLRNVVTPADAEAVRRRIAQVLRWSVVVVLCVAALGAAQQARQQKASYYRPDAEAAQAMVQWWERTYPQEKLRWVGGNWAGNALVPFFADRTVRALPGMPDRAPATLDPHPRWAQEGGLLICPLGVHGRAGADMPPSLLGADCTRVARAWLASQGQVTPHYTVLTVRRSGWRHPRPLKFDYALLPYMPKRVN